MMSTSFKTFFVFVWAFALATALVGLVIYGLIAAILWTLFTHMNLPPFQ